MNRRSFIAGVASATIGADVIVDNCVQHFDNWLANRLPVQETPRPPDIDEVDWQTWQQTYLPHLAYAKPSERHVRLGDWFDSLRPGAVRPAQVEVWARGGGKSTAVEMGVAWLAEKLYRHFVLYVSESQAQADEHVSNIASILEMLGIDRQVGKYGNTRGWRRTQLRAAKGFYVNAYGLDGHARGIKIEQYRPDVIIVDDFDSEDDTSHAIEKKISAITKAILPAGSTDCAYLFVQNLVHEDSIMSRLAHNRADFLYDRNIPKPEPAIWNLKYEWKIDPLTERPRYKITGGTPSWEGQPIDACEKLFNTIGERAFLRECQHKVDDDPRYAVFDRESLKILKELYLDADAPHKEGEYVYKVKYAPILSYRCGDYGLCGDLDIWELPEKGVRFGIGADVAEGRKNIKTDESTFDIVRYDTWAQVGSYAGKPTARQYAMDLWNISKWFNNALLNVENNSVGQVTISWLNEYGANVWENDPDNQTADDKEPDRDLTAGFRTEKRSKGLVDAELRNTIIEVKEKRPGLLIRSLPCIDQCLHYVYLPDGSRGGEGSWHDDRVRSLGLTWYIVKDHGLRPPVEQPDTSVSYGQYWGSR